MLASVGVAMAEGEKRVDSDSEVEALGIMVSAAERCVYYPEKKKDRLRKRMEALLAAAATGWVDRAEVESVAGKLKWVAHVAPSLQPRLTSAFAMAHARGRPAKVRPSAAFLCDQDHILRALDTLPRLFGRRCGWGRGQWLEKRNWMWVMPHWSPCSHPHRQQMQRCQEDEPRDALTVIVFLQVSGLGVIGRDYV